MKIGFTGLGKLGLPVALAIESKGHEVVGYDINSEIKGYIANKSIPFKEEGIQPYLDSTKIEILDTIDEVVNRSDIIFVPIQTPHHEKYEGATRIPDDRKDFDYSYLTDGLSYIADYCKDTKQKKIIAVISTCLPGTFKERIKPLLNEYVDYVYTPQFIAMGTVISDYLNPEFDLIGVESETAADTLEEFYKTINDAPILRTDITTAESIKVAYNTFITMKTVLANSWGEMAHKTGANIDDIYKSWAISSKRLLSEKYLKAGMGDSGGCHPRDNIALAYISDKVGMSHNIWNDLMASREDHAEWLAQTVLEHSEENNLPIYLLGKTFKLETNITTGSSCLLVASILDEMGVDYKISDPTLDDDIELIKAVYLVMMPHKEIKECKFPTGSVVIDVWRELSSQDGIKYVPLGNPKATQDKR